MIRNLTLAATTLLALALAPPTVEAQGATIYRLDSGTLAQGCLPPCLCPVLLAGDVQGTFLLRKKLVSQFQQVHAVDNVNWTVVSPQGTRLSVKGEGTYTLTTPLQAFPTQRLELTLSIDGGPDVEFDSGVLPVGVTPPDIAISIDDGGVCLTQSFSLTASPVPPSEVTRYQLEGTSFQEGCFPPCLCPLFGSQRVRGTFELVLLRDDGQFREYSVAALRWATGPTSLAGGRTRISGFGTYSVLEGLGPLPVEQMDLCLAFNGVELDPFSSGAVAGPPTPGVIELALTQNGLFCYDRLFELRAVEQ